MQVLSGGLTGAFVFQTTSAALTWQIRLGIAVGGAVLGIYLFQLLLQQLIAMVKRQSPQELLIKIFSLFMGLFVASLLIAVIRPVIDYMLPLQSGLVILLLVLLSIHIFTAINSVKSKELSNLFFNNPNSTAPKPNPGANPLKILDTSAIIDGRIADLCKTNFIEGGLIIPSFVLTELQKIADSPDPLRRNRGRRGLDLLNKIQKENQITIKIFDRDYEELNEVDTKLLRLAMELGAKVVTNDFNLNKVAELYGVPVLNINELSNAIKPVVLPGEEMAVHVLRDGKEYGQGIGYLEDGTMIVVEGGKSYIGMDIEILVTSVLQTSAGRMIFAKPRDYVLTRVSS
jgi:uncharacterized protein YacL